METDQLAYPEQMSAAAKRIADGVSNAISDKKRVLLVFERGSSSNSSESEGEAEAVFRFVFILCCSMLFCAVLCCAVLCCSVLFCAVLLLCCSVLCCSVLHACREVHHSSPRVVSSLSSHVVTHGSWAIIQYSYL
jgi:Flp pilus assembly protein TadB